MCSRTRTEPGHRGSGPDTLAEGLLAGDRRVLARAITRVEPTRPDHRAEAVALLARILPESGGARLLEAFRGGETEASP